MNARIVVLVVLVVSGCPFDPDEVEVDTEGSTSAASSTAVESGVDTTADTSGTDPTTSGPSTTGACMPGEFDMSQFGSACFQ